MEKLMESDHLENQ